MGERKVYYSIILNQYRIEPVFCLIPLPGKFEITHVMGASTPPLTLYLGWTKLFFLVVLAITATSHLGFGCHCPNPITQSNPYVVLKLKPEVGQVSLTKN